MNPPSVHMGAEYRNGSEDLVRKAGHEKGNQSNGSGSEGSNGFPLKNE